MKRVTLTTLLCLLLLPLGTHAQDKKTENRLTDEAELSYVATGGNTNVVTTAFKNTLKYKFSRRLLGTWKAGALKSKTDDVMTAERYFTEQRLDYAFSKRFYSYLDTGWLSDEFAGVDPRYYGGLGAGYKILKGPKHFLIGELGAISVREVYIDDTSNNFLDGRVFSEYIYALTKKNKFTQSIEYLTNITEGKDYRVNTETAVTASLNSIFSLKVSYTRKYDNMPVPSTLDDTDTIFSVALVVNY